MAEKYKNKYRIKSTRLQYWDYGWNGAYFITICTKDNECSFGAIENGDMKFSEIGRIANTYWTEIPNHFPFVQLDEYVIMPNHVHGIIIINKDNSDETKETRQNVETRQCLVSTGLTSIGQKRYRNPGKNNISSIIGSYKSIVTKHANQTNKNFNWQPRFYDRIIRNNREFLKIQEYILNNPIKWENNRNNKDGLWI